MAISGRKISGLIFEIAALALVAAIILNYRFFIDYYTLWSYKPSAEVKELVSGVALSDRGLAILYEADPKVDAKAVFNKDCKVGKESLELGCYDQGKIYVLSISNKSLSPEMETVLVHEMLHAAWSRLGDSEKKRLSSELIAYYKTLDDPDLKERMAGYTKLEPGQEANELHSILATEYDKLPPELEKYYSQYFNDRGKVVVMHQKFVKVFSDQKAALAIQLDKIHMLKADLAVINDKLDELKKAGQISQYNDLVPTQNKLVDQINVLIAEYTKGVDEYNSLSKSLNSQQIPQTEQDVNH